MRICWCLWSTDPADRLVTHSQLETNPTRMCELLIGLPDVNIEGVGDWPRWPSRRGPHAWHAKKGWKVDLRSFGSCANIRNTFEPTDATRLAPVAKFVLTPAATRFWAQQPTMQDQILF
jgi:hypothetical protein